MLVSYVCFTGRLADTMLLHASSVVVGTTQIHYSGLCECPLAGDSPLTEKVQGDTRIVCLASTTHDQREKRVDLEPQKWAPKWALAFVHLLFWLILLKLL